MTNEPVITVAGPAATGHRLQPDAIGVTQDTVIGMASSAPAATSGLTLAALAAATAYGAAATLILTAIPILVIANAYRRLNQWNANCGASFEWVGRAINPYLGYMTGWLMLAYYVIVGVALTVPLGPSVLQAFGTSTSSPWPSLAIAGFIFVAVHHPGTVHLSWAWLHPTGIDGRGSLANGFLISAFVIAGWDGTMYVNEEVTHRRTNPGRAAMWAAGLLAVLYTLVQVGLQGVVTPARLQAHSASVLVYTTQSFAGPGWGKVMAAAIALSVIATTGVGIALTARIMFGMASWQALPSFLASVSRRFATPVAASVLTAVLLLGLIWVYILGTSLANAFGDLLSVSSWLTIAFYILTALAMTVFYRRSIFASPRNILTIGVLPLAAVAFLGWVLVRSFQVATSAQK